MRPDVEKTEHVNYFLGGKAKKLFITTIESSLEYSFFGNSPNYLQIFDRNNRDIGDFWPKSVTRPQSDKAELLVHVSPQTKKFIGFLDNLFED